MSNDRVLKAIMDLGLSEVDAKVYMYIALNGPCKAREVVDKLEIYKDQLYRSIKKLKEKDIVSSSTSFPAEFSAVPFEKVLDLLAEIKKRKVEALKVINEYLMDNWESLLEQNNNHNNAHN